EKACLVTDVSPDGKYLIGSREKGAGQVGIYAISIAEKKMIPLLLDVNPYLVYFSSDGKSILYCTADEKAVIHSAPWSDGKLTGEPKIEFTLPFTIPLYYSGNAFDFSRDLSTLIFVHPSGQADLFLLH